LYIFSKEEFKLKRIGKGFTSDFFAQLASIIKESPETTTLQIDSINLDLSYASENNPNEVYRPKAYTVIDSSSRLIKGFFTLPE
jgi:hypothetical protein